MLQHPDTGFARNDTRNYWCPDCHRFTRGCAHLVEPLDSPTMALNQWQYQAATWSKRVLQVTMNTGERFQHFDVSRSMAAAFVRNPDTALLKGYRFKRVRGRA
jgi:hypothetical protein